MVKDRIFTLQQIIESENNFIRKYSQKKILSIAGEKIANYLYEYFSSIVLPTRQQESRR